MARRRKRRGFAALVRKLAQRRGIRSPRAVAAAAGRAKLGQAEMTKRAAAGRRAAAAHRKGRRR